MSFETIRKMLIGLLTTDLFKEAHITTRMYKGNFWSRMTGRKDKKLSLYPGPGDYEHETKKTLAQIRDEKIREAKRASSKQLRFLDVLYRKNIRENLPAPNCYHPRGEFDKFFTVSCKCDSYDFEPPPFGQSSKRFDEKVVSDTPGPGKYDVNFHGHCIASIYRSPFGAFTSRFRKVSDNAKPAPCDYHTNVGNLAHESAKRFKCTHEKPVRYIHPSEASISNCKQTIEVPNIVEQKEIKKQPVYHAAFKSGTERFPQSRGKTLVPDPAAYETLAAFKANRDRCDFLCRRLAPPFGSRGNRFPKIPEGINIHGPVCTRYDLRGDIGKNTKGGVISYPRKKKEEIPGPGSAHYCIHPYYTSSVLKRSFNVTLGKSKVIEELKKKEKRSTRFCNRSTKKTLRWFAAPLKEYKHCFPP